MGRKQPIARARRITGIYSLRRSPLGLYFNLFPPLRPVPLSDCASQGESRSVTPFLLPATILLTPYAMAQTLTAGADAYVAVGNSATFGDLPSLHVGAVSAQGAIDVNAALGHPEPRLCGHLGPL